MARRLDGRPRGIRRGKTVSKRRERKISGNACRHGKIVRWHLISPRILLRANEINYVVVPLSRAEEAERQADSEKKREKEKREREKEKYGDKQSSVLFDRGDALIWRETGLIAAGGAASSSRFDPLTLGAQFNPRIRFNFERLVSRSRMREFFFFFFFFYIIFSRKYNLLNQFSRPYSIYFEYIWKTVDIRCSIDKMKDPARFSNRW